METSDETPEHSPSATAKMERVAIGVVGGLVIFVLGVQIGMAMGHVVTPGSDVPAVPADCPVIAESIQIKQGAPEITGYRSWDVDVTVENTARLPTGPMQVELDFDDASFVPLRAYRTKERGARNVVGTGDLTSLAPGKTGDFFLGGDDRVNAYRKIPKALAVTIHQVTYQFPVPRSGP